MLGRRELCLVLAVNGRRWLLRLAVVGELRGLRLTVDSLRRLGLSVSGRPVRLWLNWLGLTWVRLRWTRLRRTWLRL